MNSTLIENQRILVIDDNPSIHDDFRKILTAGAGPTDELLRTEAVLFGTARSQAERLDFEIDSAHQGEEGVRHVLKAMQEERPYALAFVDVRMPPGWDGVQTISRLWEAQPDLQIVLCTAYSDYSWSDIQQRLGPSDGLLILKKPFDNVEVMQLAQALTKKWRITRQLKDLLDNVSQMVNLRVAELERVNGELKRRLEERSRSE